MQPSEVLDGVGGGDGADGCAWRSGEASGPVTKVGDAEQWMRVAGTEAVDNSHFGGVVGTAEG